MSDSDITALFFDRNEQAIAETQRKYGDYCRSIARRILSDPRDAEEAVSDALLTAWNSIPPARPKSFSSYIGRLCRNAALDRARHNARAKRGGGEYEAVLDEIAELVPSGDAGPEEQAEMRETSAAVNAFLSELPKKKRMIFVQRYWYLMSAEEIAREHFMTPAAVRMLLSRLRAKLSERLEREGISK
ncbi:MAG: sigma-70 family RNA polymerase sigma factor [Clostridia bacterium]|nr:sigma-70 family RNA polymerase sigma factor [Clostridia bacterium]